MNTLPKYIQKKVTLKTAKGPVFQPGWALREAERLEFSARLAHLDDRAAQAKKYSRYANKLRSMARTATAKTA